MKKNCNNTNADRAVIGTWMLIEVEKAIEKGYRIMKIFEVWHFSQKSSNLFTNHNKMFLKTKQNSLGYPFWVNDDAGKLEYSSNCEMNDGIQLSPK